jgi:hypothetical protein
MVAGTPNVVLVLNGVLAGVIVTLIGLQVGLVAGVALLLGATAALITIALHVRYAISAVRAGQQGVQPLFPSPPA